MSTQIKKNDNWVTVAGGTRMWVGTKAALQAALDAGELVDGTAVMVTDDYDEEPTPETITPTPVTGGAAGTISWDSFDVKKLGKMVNITINGMSHTQNVSTPGVTVIAKGLPRPALGRIYLAGINYGDDGNRASAYIDANGNLGIDTGFLLATSKLYGSICYMSV